MDVMSVRLSFNGQDFVLFPTEDPPAYITSDPATNTDETGETEAGTISVTAPSLKVAEDTYWQPLESLFASLREKDVLGEFLEDGTELLMHFPDLDLSVQEDNVYCRDITLDDLFQFHQGCELVTSLHILVTEVPRFISKYNALAQHVASVISAAVENDDDEPHPEDGHASHSVSGEKPSAPQTEPGAAEENGGEEDELDAGEAPPLDGAEQASQLANSTHGEREDLSHENVEYLGAEENPEEVAQPDSNGVKPSGNAVIEANAIVAAQATENKEMFEVEEEEDLDAAGQVTEEADQTYVTVNDGGEEDEIEDGDDHEGEARDHLEYETEAPGTEAEPMIEEAEEEVEYVEGVGEEGEDEDEGEEAAEEYAEAGKDEAEGDEHGEDVELHHYEEGEGENEAEENQDDDNDEEEEEEEDGDGSVTLEDSEHPAPEAQDDLETDGLATANGAGSHEDADQEGTLHLTTSPDPRATEELTGSFLLSKMLGEEDEIVEYEETDDVAGDQPDSAVHLNGLAEDGINVTSSKTKRPMDDAVDAQSEADSAQTDVKRARVEQSL